MKTLSNEILIDYNPVLLDQNYDFFQIKSSEKYIKRGAKILDIDFKGIQSIAFDDGASVFVLTKKESIKSFQLQTFVGDDLMVKKLWSSEIKPYILAKLFLYALSNSEFEEFSSSNLTGKFFLFKSDWISNNRKTFKALNFDIRSFGDDCAKITCAACTFTSIKAFKHPELLKEYPKYTFSIKGTLKRVFDDQPNSYIRKVVNGKKAEIPYLNFYKDTIKLTKTFLINELIEKFNKNYDKIIQINFKEIEIQTKTSKLGDESFFEKVKENLSSKQINIIDLIKDDIYEDSFNNLVSKIKELLPLSNICISNEIKQKQLNIILIHNQEYYKENDFNDPYSSFDRSTPIQCVTLEDACDKKSDAIFKTILKELEIKSEIINERKFLIDDWRKYNLSSEVIFGTIVNNVSYFMAVQPSGEFRLIKKSNPLFSYKESLYRELEKVLFSIKGDEKLIVCDDKGNVNIISDSGLIPIPNKELFVSDSPRGNFSKNEYMAGVLDINTYTINDELHYSVGPLGKTLNVSIPSAPHIYKVFVESGVEIFMKLIETMGVQFVKYNSFTVIPYPFKYLREWIKMQNN